MPDGILQLCLPARWLCTNIAVGLRKVSVTDISAGSAPTTTVVLASQVQLFQTYLLVRCNSNIHTCWSSTIVTDVSGGRMQL